MLTIGLATAFNFIVILKKLGWKRYADVLFDISFLIAMIVLFSASFNALVVGTIASALVSIYLLIFPPKFIKAIMG
jgi:uncharacterized membrane protein